LDNPYDELPEEFANNEQIRTIERFAEENSNLPIMHNLLTPEQLKLYGQLKT
jgi:hypothetical protein